MAKGQKGQKGGKKGQKKKVIDPFSRKEWYDVRAPGMFRVRNIGKTLVNRSVANKLASDSLKGRVFECSLADLQNDEVAYRKFKLVAEDIQGKNVLTNFHGMTLTTGNYETPLRIIHHPAIRFIFQRLIISFLQLFQTNCDRLSRNGKAWFKRTLMCAPTTDICCVSSSSDSLRSRRISWRRHATLSTRRKRRFARLCAVTSPAKFVLRT